MKRRNHLGIGFITAALTFTTLTATIGPRNHYRHHMGAHARVQSGWHKNHDCRRDNGKNTYKLNEEKRDQDSGTQGQ